MRRSTNAMFATLAVVCLATIVAVAIALVRYEGEGPSGGHGGKPGGGHSTPDNSQPHDAAVEKQPIIVKPDAHAPDHDK